MAAHPLSTTPGLIAAREIVQQELDEAQAEVDYAEKEGSTFSAANRDRAILKRNVLAKVLSKLR